MLIVGSLSSQVGLTHHLHIINLNACLFQVVFLVYSALCNCNLCECQCACCVFNMYQWCRVCLWQALTTSCVNTCPHLNKSEFQPLSQILFVCSALGSWSPLWKQMHQNNGPCTKTMAQSMNRYHNNCCHSLDKKIPAPVNHGRSS